MNKTLLYLAGFFAITFLILGLITNAHYGVSWDEPEHFLRGQGYLRFFLTGKENFEGLPQYNLYKARSDSSYHERSYYQHDSYGADVWFVTDRGHPPLNDILASLSNYIFYQKLGLVGDIQSYHLFNIFVSSMLVGLVFLFAAETFGKWAGLFAALILGTYPFFFSESHFNIKDPAESAFIVATIYFFWKGIGMKKIKYLLISAIMAGIALSIKFNILFLPFILGPWVLILIFLEKRALTGFLFKSKTLIMLFLFPFVMFSILIAVWPFLWQDIFNNISSVFLYYKGFGTEEGFNLNPVSTWNFYAAKWILYTTPPLTLLFFAIGIIAAVKVWKNQKAVFLLWIILFVVSVGRVSFPRTSIYGGVRQIMEYIPAMALISGVGVDFIRKFILQQASYSKKAHLLISVGIALMILSLNGYLIYRIHPNENVYFNSLIGGLSGAVRNKIPSAGNSYGNAYLQSVNWLNAHSETNAKVALIQGTSLNIPLNQLRPDINFSNNAWSGINRLGEYLVELPPNKDPKLYPYAWEYVETFLEPVYRIQVDGVDIADVWKNDLAHTKKEYQKEEVRYAGKVISSIQGNEIVYNLENQIALTRLVLGYTVDGCNGNKGKIFTSQDGVNFTQEKESFPVEQVAQNSPQPNHIYYYFVAKKTAWIKIVADDQNSCVLNKPNLELYSLKD